MDNMLINKDEALTILAALKQNLYEWYDDMDDSEIQENQHVINRIEERWPDFA